MRKNRPPFEFVGVMKQEASELQAALTRARILHKDGDMDAGGHHYEDAAREILQRRLPGRYDLGKGHVLERGWKSSSEFDVVIADVSGGGIFFSGSDGTRYYAYEGVYGLGEVKSSFRRGDRPLVKLVESIRYVKETLGREPTPSNYQRDLGPNPLLKSGWPYQNPLFTFALFGERGDVALQDIAEAFEGVPWAFVPNVLCFLDWGIVALCQTSIDESGGRIVGPMVSVPEFEETSAEKQYGWAVLPMGEPEFREAANLATLQWLIVAHLADVVLMPSKPPTLHSYLKSAGLISFDGGRAVPATRPVGDQRPETIRG